MTREAKRKRLAFASIDGPLMRVILTPGQQETARRLGMSSAEYAIGMIEAVRRGHFPADYLTNHAHYELKGKLMKSIDNMSLPQLIAFETQVKAEMAKKRDSERKRVLDEMAAMAKAEGYKLRELFK